MKKLIQQFALSPFKIVVLGCILVWVSVIFCRLNYDMDDFKQLRRGAVDLIHEDNPYANRARLVEESEPRRSDDGNEQGFKYTPVFAYLFQPFGLISHKLGQKIWFAGNLLALGMFISLCIYLAPSKLTKRYWDLITLFMMIASPTSLSLLLGQTSIVMALLLVGAYAVWYRFPSVSGLLIALATMVKLYPALMGLYALVRGPRLIACWTLVMGLLLVTILLPFYGIEHYRFFISTVISSSNHPYTAEFNFSILGFWARLLTDTPYTMNPIVEAPLLARILTIIFSATLLGVCAMAARHINDERKRLAEYCLWLCVMMLLSPINGSYNLVLLLLPFLMLIRYIEQTHDKNLLSWLILGSLLAAWPPAWTDDFPFLYNNLHSGWGLLFLTPGFYGLLIYCGLLTSVIIRTWPEQTMVNISAAQSGI